MNGGIMKKVAGLINEITLASMDQAQKIKYINKAMSEMDQIVQQNAASAEESASASEEMNSQAMEMKGFVEKIAIIIGEKTFKAERARRLMGKDENGSRRANLNYEDKPHLRKLLSQVEHINRGEEPKRKKLSLLRPKAPLPLEDGDFKAF
jgi:methyl-accepting chemotaxis protein